MKRLAIILIALIIITGCKEDKVQAQNVPITPEEIAIDKGDSMTLEEKKSGTFIKMRCFRGLTFMVWKSRTIGEYWLRYMDDEDNQIPCN